MPTKKSPPPRTAAKAPAAKAPDALPTLAFRAKVTRSDSAVGSWTWIDVPERVSRAFAPWAKSGHVRVDAAVNGRAVQGSLLPKGGGRHMMVLSAAVRREVGVSAGDAVQVELTPRVTDEVRVPDDLAAALEAHDARAAFEASDSSHRWQLVRYVMGASTPTARARAVTRVVDHLLGREATPSEAAPRRASTGTYCPACGRRLPRPDAEHACAPVPLEQPFARSAPAVRATFDALRARLEAWASVTHAVSRDGVSFAGSRRFLSAVPRRAWLELRLHLTRRVERDGVKIFTTGPRLHLHLVQLRAPEDLDEPVLALVREALAYGAPGEAAPASTRPSAPARTGWERDDDDGFFAGLNED